VTDSGQHSASRGDHHAQAHVHAHAQGGARARLREVLQRFDLEDTLTKVRPPVRGLRAVAYTAGMLVGAELDRRRGRDEIDGERIFDSWERTWSKGLLDIANVELVYTRELPPVGKKARLVISNHRTALDIPLLLAHFGGSVLSRADLAEWPLLGTCAKRARTIFVEREENASRLAALRGIRAELERGRTVSVFPEGGTFPGDEVRPFFPASVAAMKGIDGEIVPVGLAIPPGLEYVVDPFLDHIKALASAPRIRVGMAVGAPRPHPGGDARKLSESLRAEIQELVHEAREAVSRT
jgi:1-acyl-sn-glycerol-3-phosphate acyltransferase